MLINDNKSIIHMSTKKSTKTCHGIDFVKIFDIWYEEFPDCDEPRTEHNYELLKKAYDLKFRNNIHDFMLFISLIKASSFLIKTPDLLKFKWILKFENIDKVMLGKYVNDKSLYSAICKKHKEEKAKSSPTLNSKNTSEAKESIFKIYTTHIENDECVKSRIGILRIIGVPSYCCWFLRCSIESFDFDSERRIRVIPGKSIEFHANTFLRDKIESRYADLLKVSLHIDINIEDFFRE